MKVYIVDYADYDDTDIIGVFSTRDRALKVKDEYDYNSSYRQPFNMYITEWEIDRPLNQQEEKK